MKWCVVFSVNFSVIFNEKMYSDESDDTSEEVDVYRKKYRLITERCEVIQQVT